MNQKPAKVTLPLKELKPGGSGDSTRALAAEVPIALTYNGVSHVVMMASPADLKDFALGFSLSEEIIETSGEMKSLEIFEAEKGFVAKMDIPQKNFEALLKRGRNLVGQAGCGLCGVAEIDEAVRSYPPITSKPKAKVEAVFKALKGLPKHQPLNKETAAVHGAAFANWQGNIQISREDVGRHNAFDKLIGAMADKDFSGGFVILTSRCSFELVQKALAMKIPMLVTISAPTDLAVKLAKDHDLTLIALGRSDAVLVVSDPFDLFN
jgi:FdhD protein